MNLQGEKNEIICPSFFSAETIFEETIDHEANPVSSNPFCRHPWNCILQQ